MAKKLRKTLGDVNAESVTTLMALIDTQSRDTIRAWCLDYTEARFLPLYERRIAGDDRPRRALEAARSYMAGEVKFPAVKEIILKECHQAARELDDDPTSQAAARACGQGASVVHTLSHALGLYFYGAAAIAYERIGLEASREEYDAIAEEVIADMTEALRSVAVEGEPNPAKIKWYC